MSEQLPQSKDADQSPIRRKLSLRKRLLLLACSIMVGVLISEGAFRVLGLSFPRIYIPDPACGSRLSPGVEGVWTKEGYSRFRINSDGLRDVEHDLKKPANTFRIAVLGDSYSEALQVPMSDAYWAVAEQHWNATRSDTQPQLEFINFGVSGYGTAQALLMLRNYVWKYDPDLILLAFCHNDVEDNSRALSPGDVRPYFTLTQNELSLDDSFLESAVYKAADTPFDRGKTAVINSSYVLQVLKEVRQNWNAESNSISAQAKSKGGFDVFSEPESEAGRKAWTVTERLITTIHDETTERDTGFLLMTVTSASQLRTSQQDNNHTDDRFYPEDRLMRLAEKHEFSILTHARDFRRRVEETGTFLHGFENTEFGTGHWNASAHRLAGERLAEWLRESGVVR